MVSHGAHAIGMSTFGRVTGYTLSNLMRRTQTASPAWGRGVKVRRPVTGLVPRQPFDRGRRVRHRVVHGGSGSTTLRLLVLVRLGRLDRRREVGRRPRRAAPCPWASTAPCGPAPRGSPGRAASASADEDHVRVAADVGDRVGRRQAAARRAPAPRIASTRPVRPSSRRSTGRWAATPSGCKSPGTRRCAPSPPARSR